MSDEKTQVKDNKSNNEAMGCLISGIIVIFACVAIIPAIIESNSEEYEYSEKNSQVQSSACPSSPELEEAIDLYKEGKIIGKIQPELNTVYITNMAQNQMSVNDMQTLGYLTACYSAHKKGTGLVWADIYNYDTGKKVAKYSETYGFKME